MSVEVNSIVVQDTSLGSLGGYPVIICVVDLGGEISNNWNNQKLINSLHPENPLLFI